MLRGERTLYLHKDRVEDHQNPLPLVADSGGKDMEIAAFDREAQGHGYHKVKVCPGTVVFIEKQRVHRIIGEPGSIAVTLVAGYNPHRPGFFQQGS